METNLLIVADATVITCDPDNRSGRYSLLLQDGVITEIAGEAEPLWRRNPSATVVDAARKLVLPGFVNAHTHSEGILLREFTDGIPYARWDHAAGLREAVGLLCSAAWGEEVRALYLAAMAAHLQAGTTAIGEFPLAMGSAGVQLMLEAARRSGLRCVPALRTWEQIDEARGLTAQGQGCVIDVGTEEDLTVYSLERYVGAARDLGQPLMVHLAEVRERVETLRKNFQKHLLPLLAGYDALHADTLLVHLNHCTDHDLRCARERGCILTLCVRSAARKQTGYPLLRHLAGEDVRLCLGTDWGSVDMLGEMQFLHDLPLFVGGVPSYTPLEILRMATINGAHALGIAHETGSIELGKRADLVMFSLDHLHAPVPPPTARAEDLAALLLRRFSSADLTDVVVGGQPVLVNRHVEHVDEHDLAERLRGVWDRLQGVKPSLGDVRGVSSTDMPRGRIIPLVPRDRDFDAGEDPLDGARTARPEPPATHPVTNRTANLKPPPPRPAGERSGLTPELPSDVRRVFGEDDDS